MLNVFRLNVVAPCGQFNAWRHCKMFVDDLDILFRKNIHSLWIFLTTLFIDKLQLTVPHVIKHFTACSAVS
jgi:hypothetical protein